MTDAEKLAAITDAFSDLKETCAFIDFKGRAGGRELAETDALKQIAGIIGVQFPFFFMRRDTAPAGHERAELRSLAKR